MKRITLSDPLRQYGTDKEKYKHLLNIVEEYLLVLPASIFNPKLQEENLGSFNKPEVQLPFCGSNLDLRLFRATRGKPLKASEKMLKALQRYGAGG